MCFIVFDTYVIQTVVYGMEVWGGSISSSSWLDVEKKAFIFRHLGVINTTPFVLMLLEMGCWPGEIHAMIWVLKYINPIHVMDDHRIPKRSGMLVHAYRRLEKAKCSQLDGCWI